MNRYFLAILIILLITPFSTIKSQGLLQEKSNFTRQDTLRGTITPEREWWDLTYYHLDIKVNPDEKFISGKNTIQYKVLSANQTMQIDLQAPMKLTKAVQDGEELIVLKKHWMKMRR